METPRAKITGAPVSTGKFSVEDFTGYVMERPYDEVKINEHAGKSGGVRLLKEIPIVTDDGYCFVYLVKRPSRNTLKAIADKKKGDKIDTDGIEKLMMGLVLEGDMATLENDGAVYSELMKQIGEMTKQAKGQLKEA